jgi:hypothetical protein
MSSYSFKNYSANPTFGVNNNPKEAGDYILNKKNKLLNCNFKKKCNINKYNTNKCKYINCVPDLSYNYNYNLNMNLTTKLDLQNICVIEDMSGNICPTTIVYNNIPNFYNYYEIDPKGELFGNTECGVNNYLSYLVYNPK